MFLRGSQRTRDGRALLLAGLLHAAAVLLLWGWTVQRALVQTRMSQPASGKLQQRAADEVEVQIDGLFPSGAEDSVAAVRHPDSALQRVARAGHRAPPLANDGAQLGQAASDDSSPPMPAEDSPPTVQDIDLGLGADDWRRWLSETKSERPPAPQAQRASRALFRAPPVSSSGGLQEGLEAHDRAVGLGTSGPVISALYQAAHADSAPFEGSARFRITVLKSGEVEIAVSAVTSELEGWRAVAERAAEALRRAPPRIPHARQGARLVLEITAKQTFPNGVQPKELYAVRAQLEAPRLRSVQSGQRELTDKNPVTAQPAAPGESATGIKAIADLPGAYVGTRGKVCALRLGVAAGVGRTLPLLGPLLDGNCDPSNLGAKPQRMVSSLVREETLY
jgi:hypothetical protein